MTDIYAAISNNTIIDINGNAPGVTYTNITRQPGAATAGVGSTWTGSAWSAPPPIVPQVITAAQARVALANAGLLVAATAAATATPNSPLAIAWEYASEWHRNSANIASIAATLGLSAAQVDSLFIAAAEVVF